jgi:putative transposase
MNTENRDTMYLWRKLAPPQREELLSWRKSSSHPWHSPPHYASEDGLYMITAACYEHRRFLHTPERVAAFSKSLLTAVKPAQVYA